MVVRKSMPHEKCGVLDKLQAIPREDRDILEVFFRDLLFFHGFSYTLLGDKPVSVEWYDSENPKKPDVFRNSSREFRIWEKYASLFPSQHYLLLFFEDNDEDMCEFTLINKKAFRETFEKHQKKFAGVFGPGISAGDLLDLLIQKRSLWNTPMKDRDDLIGILLGYGKINAELYQQRSELWSKTRRITKNRAVPSAGYHSVEEELNALNTILQSFSDEDRVTLHFMRLPGFVADATHQETLQLKKKYSDQRKQITRRYASGDVLEITLKQLCVE